MKSMKALLWLSLDVFLIFCIAFFFYMQNHGRYDHRHMSKFDIDVSIVRFCLVAAAICILPFRLKYRPAIRHFCIYDRFGNSRKSLAVPGFVFALSILVLYWLTVLFAKVTALA